MTDWNEETARLLAEARKAFDSDDPIRMRLAIRRLFDEIAALTAALANRDAEVTSVEAVNAELGASGWLIERSGQWYAATPHTSWTIRQAEYPLDQENWTGDANKALRFARKVDAKTLIRFVGWQNATATEHVFL